VHLLPPCKEDDGGACIGEWTKPYLQRRSNKHTHANVFVPRPGEPEKPNVSIRAGDHLDSQVHVVCADCNSGWMSRIQSAAKPILIPLFNGEDCDLDDEAQKVVATWSAMATMTSEYLAKEQRRIVVTQADCTWLMERQSPPPDWRTWIGRHKPESGFSLWVKASFPVLDTDVLPETVVPEGHNPTLQTTAFTIGELFIFSMSSAFPGNPKGVGLANCHNGTNLSAADMAHEGATSMLATASHDRRSSSFGCNGRDPIL
jgi:hypothetical protein